MRTITAPILLLLVLVLCSCSLPFVTQAPLQRVPARVGTLPPEKPPGILVLVHDARPDTVVIGGLTVSGIDRVARLYAEASPGDVAAYFKSAANDAVRALGFQEGADFTLELTIKKFPIDMYRSGFGPVNCIGYGEIEAVLKARDGNPVRERVFHMTYWEDSTPVHSFDEISEEAVSRIYSQSAWESTVRILQEQFPAESGAATL